MHHFFSIVLSMWIRVVLHFEPYIRIESEKDQPSYQLLVKYDVDDTWYDVLFTISNSFVPAISSKHQIRFSWAPSKQASTASNPLKISFIVWYMIDSANKLKMHLFIFDYKPSDAENLLSVRFNTNSGLGIIFLSYASFKSVFILVCNLGYVCNLKPIMFNPTKKICN